LPLAQEDSTLISTFLVSTLAGAAGAATGLEEQLEAQLDLLLIFPRSPLLLPQPKAKLSETKTPAKAVATAKTKNFFILTSRLKMLTAPMTINWHLAN